MRRNRRTAIDKIVVLAEREGLSYGRYVAREYASHTQRKRHIPDVCKPRGISTVQAALLVDCPRRCVNYKAELRQAVHEIEPPKAEPKAPRPHTGGKKVETPVDEAVKLYEGGSSVAEIMKRLGATRQNIEGRLRRAGIEMRKCGHPRLSAEKITKIRALRAEGKTYRDIAVECDVSESMISKYLKTADG